MTNPGHGIPTKNISQSLGAPLFRYLDLGSVGLIGTERDLGITRIRALLGQPTLP